MASTQIGRINVADVLAVDASVAQTTGGADYGITSTGFNPKPFARLLAEKVALAQALNLDPAAVPQKIDRWNELDPALADCLAVRDAAQSTLKVDIQHTEKLTGGELQWPDERYRDLLLRAPRSIWTADAIEIAVS